MVIKKSRKTLLNGLPQVDTSNIPKFSDFRGRHKISLNLDQHHSPVVCKVSPGFDLYMKKIQIDEMKKNNLLLSKAQISDLILNKLKNQDLLIKSNKKSISLF